MDFTTSQEAAIMTKGQNVLVSASAGSGKTRVLVERVIRRLLAGENVNEFLIVTFTEAAAAEMKERLEGAIRHAVEAASGTERQHLLKQLRLLNVANISTLHAFALRLIEQYHYTIDLDPQFRLSDDAERTLLMMAVYDDLLEVEYMNDEEGDFSDFAAQFVQGSGDDRSLQDAVFTLFNFAMARPDTTTWLNGLVQPYQMADGLMASTFYQEKLQPMIQKELQALALQSEQLLNQAPDTQDVAPAINRLWNLQDDADNYQRLSAIFNQFTGTWDDLCQLMLSFQASGWGMDADGKRKNFTAKHDPELKQAWEAVKEQRATLKERFDALQETYFSLDDAGMKLAMTGAANVLARLVAFTQRFREAFLTEKLQRKVLDFNDLEHFALAIVNQPAVQAELQHNYVEVMVDEYQDTNQLQEAILSQIATGDNTFQVGDIKQSIYKFRQADPTLFGSKLTSYPQTDGNTVITLQENFRSQPNVTNFINFMFAQMMSEKLGDVEYVDEAELVAGATYYPEDLPKKAELLVYLNDIEKTADDFNGSKESDEDGDTELQDAAGFTTTTGQINLMALKIRELMDQKFQIYDRKKAQQRAVEYGDITVLVPTKQYNLAVIDAFKALDIPIVVNGAENYFQTTEISVMMSLLQIIDNPHQDIPLAAVLRSPLYGLAENALALIRAQSMSEDYYTAVKNFSTMTESERLAVPQSLVTETLVVVQRFLQDLNRFRALAVQNQIVDLIWEIYNTTGWLDYVGGLPSGPQRQANLHALYERAAMYQKSSFVGLYQFISYVSQLQKQDKDLGEADANVASDSVSLMTIHHSKGLEFPIVFMLNATRKMISAKETQGAILLDAEAGAGMNYIDISHHLQLPTLQRAVVKDALIKGAFAEQLRVLYVALTRAEQQLFVVGSYKNVDSLWQKWSLSQAGTDWMLPEWVRLEGKSFMDLMGMTLMRHPKAAEQMSSLLKYDDKDVIDFSEMRAKAPKQAFAFGIDAINGSDLQMRLHQIDVATEVDSTAATPVESNLVQDWSQVLSFEYEFDTAMRATSYQSVSEIKRLFEDPDLGAGRTMVDNRLQANGLAGLRFTNDTLPEPKFMAMAQAQVSPASVGTATHLVLQRIDLSNGAPTLNDLQALVTELVTQELIEERLVPAIALDKIVQFFSESTLGTQMVANADSLEREVPFALLLDADQLYKDFNGTDKVLVHGIIDGYFKVGDDVWLFDYKTDHVDANSAKTLLTQRYAGQLNLYAQALVAMGKPVTHKIIYSLAAEQEIELA